MKNINEMKKIILQAMIDYYGAEHQEKIADIIANTNVYEWANAQDAKEIKEKENYFTYGFDNDYILIEKFFYDKVYANEENCKIVDNQFIALNSNLLNIEEKIIYALSQAYIMAFMSNGTLEKNNHIYSKRRGNIYINYKEDDRGNFIPQNSVPYFEDACTKYDACAITRSITKVNEEDFCIDDLYNTRDYAAILLDNPVVRNIINYGRIEHKFVAELGDNNFTKIQSALNEEFPNIIINEHNYLKKSNKLDELFKSLIPIKEELDNLYISNNRQK